MKIIMMTLALVSGCCSVGWGGNCPNLDTTTRTIAAVSVSVNGSILTKINNKLEEIPNVTATVTAAAIDASGTAQDCCNSQNAIVANGVKNYSTTASISGNVSGTVWGYSWPGITHSGRTFGVDWSFGLTGTFGVTASGSITASATVGKIDDSCENKDWLYSGAEISIVPSLTATIAGEACANINNITNSYTFSVVPADITATVSGNVGFNTASADSGSYGSLSLNSIVFTADFNVPPFDPYTYTKQLYP